ncbi:hypothetical protein HLRTI_001346 [Halorhabdus tiamatea SARL4B]|uniref:Uncharacterized protein n=1 Tax=Halorhabdus tiamatea SARL4B TaxID=1033806 RepID=F7PI45_9EURY|nr:hypothetical protein [Halorhabdus tiamatea]ERJ06640.1 hypothetical protein HLRTI_001346 [Halorhabdus tiamatea SARL4B]CCQ32209.1 hypothetical protein HTIA_0058 [Halorhabdus tiamatea SARL4B]
MATIVKKTIDGAGPYLYHVEYSGGKHHWKYLGPAGAVDETPGQVPDSYDPDTEYENGPRTTLTAALDDPGLQAVASEATTDELADAIEEFSGEKDILQAVKEVTDDNRLETAIEDINGFTPDLNAEVTREQADYIEEQLGFRPFDLTLTDPENEHQDPMISLDVDDVWLTENTDLNADLLEHAVSEHTEDMYDAANDLAEYGDYPTNEAAAQERIMKDWADVVGEETIHDIKQSVTDPDTLGFALPSDVPASGDDPGRTPLTDIPYIGGKTAADIHPSDDVMAIEDLHDLSERQQELVDTDTMDGMDSLDNDIPTGIASTVPEADQDHTGDTIGRLLGLMDRRDADSNTRWSGASNVFGIDDGGEMRDSVSDSTDLSRVTNITKSEDRGDAEGYALVETENGDTAKFEDEYIEFLENAADAADTEIVGGDNVPAFVRLPDGNNLAAAARVPRDE